MTKTQNLNLNQWEAADPIRREDFNADNAAIDAALGTAVKLETGSYKGGGVYGKDNPTTLTFSFPPKVVGIMADVAGSSVGGTILVAGQSKSSGVGSVYNSSGALNLIVTWSGNSVSWYDEDNYASAASQLNSGSTTYHYFAIG